MYGKSHYRLFDLHYMLMNEEAAFPYYVAWAKSNPLRSTQVRLHRRPLHRQQHHNKPREMRGTNSRPPTVRRNAPQRHRVMERHRFGPRKLRRPGIHMATPQRHESLWALARQPHVRKRPQRRCPGSQPRARATAAFRHAQDGLH